MPPAVQSYALMSALQVNTVPVVAERLDCIIYQREFEESLLKILPDLRVLHKACRAVIDSDSLKVMLACVLHLGNRLNAGSYRAGACGFAIHDLTKVSPASPFGECD